MRDWPYKARVGGQPLGQPFTYDLFDAALTGFLNNAVKFAQYGILGQCHGCQIKKQEARSDALLARVACLCNNQARHQPCPTGLMVGTAPATRISVEIFVKQYQILPVRI
jgi:hypothetical protein